MGLAKTAIFVAMLGVACIAAGDYQPVAPRVPTALVCLEQGHGSAVSLGDGLFLSAKHVTDDEKTIIICLGKQKYSAKLERDYEGRDLALIRSERRDLPAVPIRCDELPVGEQVFAEGFPLSMGFMRMHGVVAQPIRWDVVQELQGPTPRQTIKVPYRGLQWLDMRAAGGMSGGPVLDSHGRLVGITVIVSGSFAAAMVPGPVVCETLGGAR